MKTLQTVNGHRVVLDPSIVGNLGLVIKGAIMRKPPDDREVLRDEVWYPDGRVSLFNPTEWDLVLEDRS